MIRRAMGIMGLGTAVWLVACSSSSSGGVASSPEGACDQYVTTFCNKIAECFPVFIKTSYKDANECISRQKSQCLKALAAPSTALTPGVVSTCASAYGSASCNDIFKLPDACKTPAGTLADGSPCGEDAQCSGRSCNITGDAACGACAKRAGAGADCASTKCDDGLVCASNDKCVAPGNAGATCGDNQPCQTPLVCSKGTCSEGAAAGAACSQEEPCNLFKGLVCDPTSNTCKELKVANAGEACGFVGGNFVTCGAGGDCNQNGATGTCRAALADGASCGADGPNCQEPAECINGVCTINDPGACK
jgi:hypothetical protein